jgi:cobalamin biosynthesis Mg chelatase CobN
VAEEMKYSLISVDVADSNEEVVRVDASGAHAQSPASLAPESAAQSEAAHQPTRGQVEEEVSAAKQEKSTAHKREAVSDEDGYTATREDLEGSVPMAGLQKVIIAVVVLILVGFAVYFGICH